MTISLRVEHGAVVFPEGICPPDGTVVQIVLPAERSPQQRTQPFRLRTFKGDGLLPGVTLADTASLWSVLDSDGKFSQLF